MNRIYKVRVRCIGEKGDAGKPKRLHRAYAVVLIEAEDCEHAAVAAVAFAEDRAAGDVRWKEFEWLEAAMVTLPIMVSEL